MAHRSGDWFDKFLLGRGGEYRAKSKKTGAKANEIISYITQPMILSRAAYVRIIGGFRIIRKVVNAKHRTIILPNLYIRLFQRKRGKNTNGSISKYKIFHRLQWLYSNLREFMFSNIIHFRATKWIIWKHTTTMIDSCKYRNIVIRTNIVFCYAGIKIQSSTQLTTALAS